MIYISNTFDMDFGNNILENKGIVFFSCDFIYI